MVLKFYNKKQVINDSENSLKGNNNIFFIGLLIRFSKVAVTCVVMQLFHNVLSF